MTSVRKSLAISFADKYSVMLIHFASTMILARLLTPEEIGVYSVGAVIAGFAHMIRDFGVANYLVQEKELTRNRIQTAFGITLLIAWGAALLLYFSSGPIAHFYSEPGVSTVIQILAFSFLFIPFSSTVLGLLRREMKFKHLFVINFLSACAHAITGVGLACYGFGFESLAWASMVSAAATVIAAIIMRPAGAEFTPSYSEFKRIFSFGSYSSATGIIQEAGLSAPDLAIGRLQSFDALGYYSRAMGFVSIFNYAVSAAINPVIIPAFAKHDRGGQDLKQAYLRALEYYTVLAWPFFAYLLLVTQELITLLYGAQWSDSVQPAQILCIAFIIRSLTAFTGNYLIATGQVKTNFKIQLILQVPRVIATIAAAFHSIEAVAIVQALFYIAAFFISHVYAHNQLAIRYIDIIQATAKSAFITLSSLIPPALFLFLLPPQSNATTIIVSCLAFGLAWLICIFAFNHGFKHEIITIANAINKVRKRS